MLQNACSSHSGDLESVVHGYWDKKNGLVHHVARRLHVWEEREDLAQNFWLHVVEEKKVVEDSEHVSSLLNTIAVHEVIDFASRDKLRVHVSFEEDVDALAILKTLELESAFELLKKPDPFGLPMYSGKIWPSRVEDIQNHPNRVYFAVKSYRRCALVDLDTLADLSQPAEDIKTSDAAAQHHGKVVVLEAAIEELQEEYSLHTWILILRDAFKMGWSEIAQHAGVCKKTCQKYYKAIKGVFRKRYPYLRNLFDEA